MVKKMWTEVAFRVLCATFFFFFFRLGPNGALRCAVPTQSGLLLFFLSFSLFLLPYEHKLRD